MRADILRHIRRSGKSGVIRAAREQAALFTERQKQRPPPFAKPAQGEQKAAATKPRPRFKKRTWGTRREKKPTLGWCKPRQNAGKTNGPLQKAGPTKAKG
jgi:hypothetical protein